MKVLGSLKMVLEIMERRKNLIAKMQFGLTRFNAMVEKCLGKRK